jgi:hypothetical protein
MFAGHRALVAVWVVTMLLHTAGAPTAEPVASTPPEDTPTPTSVR